MEFVHQFTFILVLILCSLLHMTSGIDVTVVKSIFRYSRKFAQLMNLKESCYPKWIITDKIGLERALKDELIGQEIASLEIPQILGNYWQKNIGSTNLFLCFYGSPGTGKSFTTKLISQYLFARGDKSDYYQFYSGSDPALSSGDSISQLKSDMIESIQETVNECPYSLIVFDEVDKFPNGFLDSILIPFIEDSNQKRKPLGKSTFIFLTNIGENYVIEKALEIKKSFFFSSDVLSKYDLVKNKIKLQNSDSFSMSNLVKKGYIKHFIPFVPLTPDSFTKCLEKALPSFGQVYTTEAFKNFIISNAVKRTKLVPESNPYFIKTGCKRVQSIINIIISEMRDKNIISDEL